MTTIEIIEQPALGEHGEPCNECGAPLAADQRYCLNCGARRAGPRVDFGHYLNDDGGKGSTPPGTAAGAASSGRDWTPIVALGGLVVLGLMLAVGVLIGKDGNGGSAGTTPAPIVNVGSDTGGGASTTSSGGNSVDTANTTFKSDWPSGKDGYTVELGSLPKQGTTADQVDSAKSDATGKGAPDVGALDSDQYASLPSGNYILYSGVFTSKADASKALKSLKSKFPDAKVVQVSTKASSGGGGSGGSSGGSLTSSQNRQSDAPVTASDAQLQQLNSNSGSNYEKQSQKLPDEIKTQGKPPPTDNKEPGGGSGGGVVIK